MIRSKTFAHTQTASRWVVLFWMTSVTRSVTREHACNVIVISKSSVIFDTSRSGSRTEEFFCWLCLVAQLNTGRDIFSSRIDSPRACYHFLDTNLVSLFFVLQIMHSVAAWLSPPTLYAVLRAMQSGRFDRLPQSLFAKHSCTFTKEAWKQATVRRHETVFERNDSICDRWVC